MAKRDPAKTARNKEIRRLSGEIKALLPDVLEATGYKNEASLNATYGGKHQVYIDIRNEVIDGPQQFRSLYLQGFMRYVKDIGPDYFGNNTYIRAYKNVQKHPIVWDWLSLFLERTYLREYENISKKRPTADEAVMWIGQENASYGILITPRFRRGQWENDGSEIRRFKPKYWTIGHILETGFVVPSKEKKIPFENVSDYLTFFTEVIVRNSGSKHEQEIAEHYCSFVLNSENPLDIPLLIPEFRYGGLEKKHKYRLDFTVINSANMSKVGFELSPWSTHGKLVGTKGKKQFEINEEASQNFEKEMRKLKDYFRQYRITTLVYTDSDLEDYDAIFEEIRGYLIQESAPKQLELQSFQEFLAYDFDEVE